MAGGKFRVGTGGKTAKGIYATPTADRKGNKSKGVRNITPREITSQGK